MNTLEVLCVTMHQKDFSKISQMNISSDVIFANQTDTTEFKQINFDNYTAKMISTNTVGVGKNRNLALMYADADILLFADDDVRYYDGYEKAVLEAYSKYPDADMIIFSMDIVKDGNIIRKISNKDKRLHRFNAMKYGTCVCSIRRESLVKNNIWFSAMYGGGTEFGHGEDTLFILDAFRKTLKIYSNSYVLGSCSKDESTCFNGYNDKYFFDQGVFYAGVFGILKRIMCIRICIKRYKFYKGEMSFLTALNHTFKGIKFYKNM